MLNQILEPEQSLPVAHESDLLVAGGGPAGFSAAISAARSGVSVTLIELGGALGGVWTQGLLSYIGNSDWTYDSEAMKYVLEKLDKSANIHIEDRYL